MLKNNYLRYLPRGWPGTLEKRYGAPIFETSAQVPQQIQGDDDGQCYPLYPV
jgi:hypothetical protein